MSQDKSSNIKITSRRDFVIGSSATAISLTSLNKPRLLAASSTALDLAEENRSELVGLLSQLVSIKSQTGETAKEAQKIVNNYLGGLPYRIEQSQDRPSKYQNHPEYMPPNPP
ncbi:MAG: hypothetical protein VYA14_02330, partial [Pseudomonadota bacterium]|nr:hypothetical protein [Pseudomonadota bacterium]